MSNIIYIKEIDELTGKIGEWANFDLYKNGLTKTSDEVEVSDIDSKVYIKGKAPMKSNEDKLNELKDESKKKLENLTARLREEQSTFNGITIAKTYENINEWLTFAKYKADENISIPAQAVMMSYSGQNMNAFSVPQIEGAMYQAMVEITSINANYYSTLASIENATTAEEIPNIQG